MADPEELSSSGPEYRTIITTGPQNDRYWMFFMENLTQWTMPFMFMMVELALCLILVMPLPAIFRRTLLTGIRNVWNSYPRFRLIYKTTIGFFCYLFCDSLRRMYVVSLRLQVGNNKANTEMASLYAAERNAYLCGFTVFLFLLLLRFEAMLGEMTDLEVKVHACEEQHPPIIVPRVEKTERETVKSVNKREKLVSKGWVPPSENPNAPIDAQIEDRDAAVIGDLDGPRYRVKLQAE